MSWSVPAPRERAPLTYRELLANYERLILIKAIQLNGGSRTKAAVSLGMRRGLLYSRIHTLGIDLSQIPPRIGRPPKENHEMRD
jgi:DNA-binding NtrC family response regulator